MFFTKEILDNFRDQPCIIYYNDNFKSSTYSYSELINNINTVVSRKCKIASRCNIGIVFGHDPVIIPLMLGYVLKLI